AGNVEGFAFLAFFPALVLLFALLGAFTYGVEQAALFFLQSLLAVGDFLRTRTDGRRAARRAARANVGQLFERPTIERHHVEIALASEVDPFLIEGEVRIGFAIDGAGDLPPR